MNYVLIATMTLLMDIIGVLRVVVVTILQTLDLMLLRGMTQLVG